MSRRRFYLFTFLCISLLLMPLYRQLVQRAHAQSPLESADPRSIVAGDFHGNGMVDLVSGFASGAGGFVKVQRTNLGIPRQTTRTSDFRPLPPAHAAAPFISGGEVFATPIAPDFLGAGDFDNDGHLDLLVASRVDNAIYMLPGDGHGRFGAPVRTVLPGTVTALVTGEINRADGLADFVIGVKGPEGPQVMVFESPLGAWRATPEVFPLPGEATALALGRFRGNYTLDLAVAVGSGIMFIEGRDRKLALDQASRAMVPPARLSHLSFSSPVVSLAAGDFAGNGPGNGPGVGKDRIAVLLADGSIHIVRRKLELKPESSQAKAAWESRLFTAGTASSAARMIAGPVTGRGGDDLILLDSSAHRVHIQRLGETAPLKSLDTQSEPVAALVVRPGGELVVLKTGAKNPTFLSIAPPTLTFTVTNTNDSGPGSLRQAILSANANTTSPNLINFNITGTGPFLIKPLTNLPSLTAPSTVIDATTQPGYTNRPIVGIDGGSSLLTGISITGAKCGVKGLSITAFKVGIVTGPSSQISGNFVGMSFDGVTAGANGTGILVDGSASSSSFLGNNLVSGNLGNGVEIDFGATGNILNSNFIGVDVNGIATTASANRLNGVSIGSGSSLNTIGGGNVISGNGTNGVLVTSATAHGNLIQGNFIGTDPTGTTAQPNKQAGVYLDQSPNNTIGGTAAGAANLISGNGTFGSVITGNSSANNVVQGNILGLDASRTKVLPNFSGGLAVDSNSNKNPVGGTAPGAGNIISGNTGDGILLGSGTSFNVLEGNKIGESGLGNSGNGVRTNNSSDNTVGPGNTITGNGMNGVDIDTGTVATKITQNSIFKNFAFPIKLENFTANTCGTFTGGNFSLNTAVITSATRGTNSVTIQGTFNSTANKGYIIEFFAGPDQASAGKIFLGSGSVTTGSDCKATFNATLNITDLPNPAFVSATVTDSMNDTSQYAAAFQVSGGSAPTVSSVSPNAGPTAGGNTVTITGTNFVSGAKVNFGSTMSPSVNVASATQIMAVVPAGSAGMVDVTVTTPGGTSATTAGDKYTYEARPTVSSLSPNAGPTAGGNTVTIKGTNFVSGASVKFGATASGSVKFVSPLQLTAIAPAHAHGTVDLMVTTPGGTSASVPGDHYAYGAPTITSFTPTSGITGSTVTINGTSFVPGMSVKFGSIPTRFTFVSGTFIKATVPNGAVTGKISAATSAGTGTSASIYTVTLSITSFSPASGPAGTAVTINGVGFNSSSAVKFNGVAASSVIFVSSTQLKATVPSTATTGPITVTNTTAPTGTAGSATNFTKT